MIVRSTKSLPSTRVLVVTGLKLEAACLEGGHVQTVCSGTDGWQLRKLLCAAEPREFDLVMSFGLAAGLDPGLKRGEAVVGSYVLADRRRYDADEARCLILLDALAGVGRKVVMGPVIGVDRLVGKPEEKAALRNTGALVADMESHIAAEWSAAHRLPFTMVRIVADPATRSLPENVASCVKQDGRLDALRILRIGVPAWKNALEALRLGLDVGIGMAALRKYGAILSNAPLGSPSCRRLR